MKTNSNLYIYIFWKIGKVNSYNLDIVHRIPILVGVVFFLLFFSRGAIIVLLLLLFFPFIIIII